MGREQAHQVECWLRRLIEHLLKLDVSGDLDPRRGWIRGVKEQRIRLRKRLEMNASLHRRLPEFLDRAWPDAVTLAKAGLREDEAGRVVVLLPYRLEKLLDEGYFGEREAAA